VKGKSKTKQADPKTEHVYMRDYHREEKPNGARTEYHPFRFYIVDNDLADKLVELGVAWRATDKNVAIQPAPPRSVPEQVAAMHDEPTFEAPEE
jgi:hypothetical protein